MVNLNNSRLGPRLQAEFDSLREQGSNEQLPVPDGKVTPASVRGGKAELAPVSQAHYFTVGSPERHYYLELVESPGGPVIDSVELPYVSRMECDLPLAVARTYTIADLYEEHSGFVERTFGLSGRSGYSELALVRFHKLRNFLEKYAKLSADNKNAFVRGKDIRLVLNFPWEGESFYATMMSFKPMSTTGTSRVSFEYSIILKAYAYATRKWTLPKNIIQYLDAPGYDAKHTGLRHPCFRDSVEAYQEVPPDTAYIYRQRDAYDEALRQLDGTQVDSTMYQTLYEVMDRSFATTYSYWDGAPYDIRQYERLSGRFNTIIGWVSWVSRQVEELLGVQFRHLVSRTGVRELPTLNGVAPVPDRTGQGPVTVVTVQAGDRSVMDVAYRELGDRSAWWRIIQLNGMLDARTRNDGTVLQPGHRILIPASDGLVPSQAQDIYGTDVRIGDDGDFVLVGTTGIAVVSGVENVEQNLDHRYGTVRGTNRAFPEFGLPELVGTIATSDMPGMVMSAVKTQTASDHRVTNVSKLETAWSGGTVQVSVVAHLVANPAVSRVFLYPG